MTTSFAFILGVYPLVVAQGAAAGRDHAGKDRCTDVVTADLAIRLFVIPMLYVTFQSIRERSSARFRRLRPRPTGTD
jgi:multidrug efflux pump subunit AcrB